LEEKAARAVFNSHRVLYDSIDGRKKKERQEAGAALQKALRKWEELHGNANEYEAKLLADKLGIDTSWDNEIQADSDGNVQVKIGLHLLRKLANC
jgi:hypothetical protein